MDAQQRLCVCAFWSGGLFVKGGWMGPWVVTVGVWFPDGEMECGQDGSK